MNNFEQLAAIIEAAKPDADKFYNKNNAAAGRRIRKAMQEVKKLAQGIRQEVIEAKHQDEQA